MCHRYQGRSFQSRETSTIIDCAILNSPPINIQSEGREMIVHSGLKLFEIVVSLGKCWFARVAFGTAELAEADKFLDNSFNYFSTL